MEVSGLVLFITDLLHPIDDFAIKLFLDGEVGHGGGGGGAVPVFFAGRKPDDVAGPDVLDGSAPALGKSGTSGDDEGLAKRMGVPRGAGAGLEGDAGADGACGCGCGEQWVNAHGAGEPIGRALVGGLGAGFFDVHRFEIKPKDAERRKGFTTEARRAQRGWEHPTCFGEKNLAGRANEGVGEIRATSPRPSPPFMQMAERGKRRESRLARPAVLRNVQSRWFLQGTSNIEQPTSSGKIGGGLPQSKTRCEAGVSACEGESR